jgi:hypothetical protein
MVLCALAPGPAFADSVVTALALAPGADCTSNASVNWTFTYTTPPPREFASVTALQGGPQGTVIGALDQASSISGGSSFSGLFNSPISIPQQPNTLIGTYGGIGEQPPTVNTAEFFILYNCTTRQVLYQCRGNNGRCPRTAVQALAIISAPIPVDSPVLLAATLVLLGGLGIFALRRRVRA